MRIIVDAFGGDNAPVEILKGCALALEEFSDLSILLTGSEEIIRKVCAEQNISLDRMEIVDAPQVITMEEHAGEIMRSKKDCSMAQGLRRLAAGEGDAFVTAGSTGALVVGATLIVKRIKGIKRAALAPVMPNDKGFFMLIDCGANVECKPENLQQFGMMGSIYMEKVMGVKNPRVGLVNVGTEETKGGDLQLQTFELLKNHTPVNFVGNVEAREIPKDGADVVVTDGFTGNVILKLYEGVAMTMLRNIKRIFLTNLKTKLAAAMVKSNLAGFKKKMDYNEYGGAPLMGISKPVFKSHGSSDANTFRNALRNTYRFVKGDVVGEISAALAQMKTEDGEE
ncbi:MAG: phosphate acyltransferase PlsX [Firmicutes bacterium]|nr:phosphate acyltransferase PlsX [Bacillota bacterium]